MCFFGRMGLRYKDRKRAKKGDITMPILTTNCRFCGAPLRVDDSLETAVCTYCGQTNRVREVLNEHAKGRLQAGEAFLQIREWKKAEKAFSDVSDITPQDHRGLWGSVRARTEEFSAQYDSFSNSEIEVIETWYKHALHFVPGDEEGELTKTYSDYFDEVIRKRAEMLKELHEKADSLGKEIEQINDRIRSMDENGWISRKTKRLQEKARRNAQKLSDARSRAESKAAEGIFGGIGCLVLAVTAIWWMVASCAGAATELESAPARHKAVLIALGIFAFALIINRLRKATIKELAEEAERCASAVRESMENDRKPYEKAQNRRTSLSAELNEVRRKTAEMER